MRSATSCWNIRVSDATTAASRRRASGPAARCRHCRAGWRRHGRRGRPPPARRSPARRPRSTRSRPASPPRARPAPGGSGGRARPRRPRAGVQQRAGEAAGARARLRRRARPAAVPGSRAIRPSNCSSRRKFCPSDLRRAEAVARDDLAQRRQRRQRLKRVGAPCARIVRRPCRIAAIIGARDRRGPGRRCRTRCRDRARCGRSAGRG